MKLLYIHQYFKFPSQSGGTRSYDLATSFVARGIQVTVIGSSVTSEQGNKMCWTEFERDGIRFFMLNCQYNNNMSFFQRIWSFLSFMFFASLKALKIECDMVLVTSTPLTIAVPALVRKWFKGTPFIFEIRDVWPDVPIRMGFIKNRLAVKFLYWFEKLIYRNAYWLVPLSTGMNENIQKRYPNKKFTVIPNICELNRFQQVLDKVELPFPLEGKKIILYAGTLGNVNGIKYVVDLAFYVKPIDSSIIFLIVGDGKERDEVLKYAREKEILGCSFVYQGSVMKSQLPYLYSIATTGSSFVIDNPALWDNSANKFFDTLAASRPIVINHRGWQADVIEQYNVGYVLPHVLTQDAVEAFVNYLNDEVVLNKQAGLALHLAKEKFSLDIAVDCYMSIFNRM